MAIFKMSVTTLINMLNGLPPEALWLFSFLLCFSSILVLLRFFGAPGLYVYIALAVIVANIQVLKAVEFSVYSFPVPLGTILFTSTYLCTDILTEYYGARAARKGVYLGFAAMLLMTLFMLLTLGFRPLDVATAPEGFAWAVENHEHMRALFTPTPALFVAGMTAYLISQLNDVWIYNWLKRATAGRFMWLRNNVSTWVAVFVDNVVFSILAWIVLAEHPLAWSVVWKTYILGTYGLRVLIALLDTPFIYLAKRLKPRLYKKQPLPL